MEFGIFVQGYTPQFRRDTDPEAEHHALMNELELVQAADAPASSTCGRPNTTSSTSTRTSPPTRCSSDTSRSCTERIHLGSGIFNPLPQVNHPAKVAEKVAMLDHLSGGRVEFGTGRGAGSHEILGFLPDMKDLSGTTEIWEDVIREFPKMWTQETYEGLRGQVLVAPAPQDPAQALREAAPADVVRRRQHVELRDGRALRTRRARASPSAASTSSRPCSRPTSATS